LACATSAECIIPPRDRSYCHDGACVPGDGTVFDGAAYLGYDGELFPARQSGVLGGHHRVAALGCHAPPAPGSTADVTGRGFEMMAIGPLGFDNDTILIAIRNHTDPGPGTYTYLSTSLDRCPCKGVAIRTGYCAQGGRCCAVERAEFYGAVVEHVAEWAGAFQPAMELTLPYGERRQLDMARGVLVSTSAVWIGNQPNYGTSTYWLGSPPVRAMMDTVAVADSLPLTSLSLDNALLEWGLFDSALAKVGYYLDTFIFQNGTPSTWGTGRTCRKTPGTGRTTAPTLTA